MTDESLVGFGSHPTELSCEATFSHVIRQTEALSLQAKTGLAESHGGCSMRKTLLASVAVTVLCAAPAIAANMPVKAPVYKAPAAFSWTGCYIGAHAGGGWGVASAEAPDVADSKPHGFVGGGQVGCDYQASNWVLGVDGSFSGSRMHDQRTELFSAIPFSTLDTFETKIDWLASVTGRVGY